MFSRPFDQNANQFNHDDPTQGEPSPTSASFTLCLYAARMLELKSRPLLTFEAIMPATAPCTQQVAT
jgi:hypothetical protein